MSGLILRASVAYVVGAAVLGLVFGGWVEAVFFFIAACSGVAAAIALHRLGEWIVSVKERIRNWK